MKKVITTLTLLTVTTLGIATVVWAEHGGPRDGKHHGKHPFGKMMFKKMDTDNDGAISVRQHEAGLQKMLERQRAHFAKMDKDGDGLVTKKEAKDARKKWVKNGGSINKNRWINSRVAQ